LKNIVIIASLIIFNSFFLLSENRLENSDFNYGKSKIHKLIVSYENNSDRFSIEKKEKLIEEISNISDKINYNYGVAYSKYLFADLEYSQENYNKALSNIKKSEDIFKDKKDTLYEKSINLTSLIYIKLKQFKQAKQQLLILKNILKKDSKEHETYYRMVYVCYKLKQNAEALEYLEKYYKTIDKNNKSDLADAYNYYSIIYKQMGDEKSLEKALDYKHKQLKLLTGSKDYESLHYIYFDTAELLKDLRLYDEAIAQYKKALEVIDKAENNMFKSKYMVNLSYVYKHVNENDKAINLLLEAYNLVKSELKNKDITLYEKEYYNLGFSIVANNLGAFYKEKKDYEKASKFIKESLEIGLKYKSYKELSSQFATMAEIYVHLERYQEANKYIDKAREISNGKEDKTSLLNLLSLISNLYAAKNNFKDAYQLKMEFIHLKDSLLLTDNAKDLVDKSLKFSNDQLSTTAEQTQSELSFYKQITFYAIIILILLGIIIKFIFSKLKMKRLHAAQIESKNKQLNDKNKQLEVFNIELTRKEELLHYQNEQLQKNEQKLQDQNEQLSIFNSELMNKEDKLKQQNIVLVKKEEELKDQNEKLRQKENDLEAQNKQLVIFNREINERDRQLVESNKELEYINKQKNILLSIVGHDLKNPIQGILSTSEILTSYFWEKDKKELFPSLTMIKKSAISLKMLIENVFEWATSQTGQLKLDFKEINLYHLTNDIKSFLQGVATEKKINIGNYVEGDHIGLIDLGTISTVLRNLMSNAVKFTNENGDIIISSEEYDNKFIQLNVIDTGIGMDQETIDKLFDFETKKSKYGTKNEKGTGLGLLLVKEFVELNGGQLFVKSQLGMGSTFSFTVKKSEPKSNPKPHRIIELPKEDEIVQTDIDVLKELLTNNN